MKDPVFIEIKQNDLANGRPMSPPIKWIISPRLIFIPNSNWKKSWRKNLILPKYNGRRIWLVPDFINRWQDATYQAQLLEYILQTETDPVMIGISAHLLGVGKKS